MYNCPTFFLFCKCLADRSYWTNLYLTVADNELHLLTISNLNYTVFVSLAHYAGINLCSCILIGVFQEAHILFWNTLLSQTHPDFLSWYPVVRLIKVYKHQVQFFLHFPVFLYHLPCCKYGISCPSSRHETELLFSYGCLFPQSSVDYSFPNLHGV